MYFCFFGEGRGGKGEGEYLPKDWVEGRVGNEGEEE